MYTVISLVIAAIFVAVNVYLIWVLIKKIFYLQDELEEIDQNLTSTITQFQENKKAIEHSLFVIDKITKMRVSGDEPEIREIIKAMKNAQNTLKQVIMNLERNYDKSQDL
jgi:predicted PurR-regulated permease PerM